MLSCYRAIERLISCHLFVGLQQRPQHFQRRFLIISLRNFFNGWVEQVESVIEVLLTDLLVYLGPVVFSDFQILAAYSKVEVEVGAE